MGGVRADLGLRRRGPHRRLLHQRHRERQRPHPSAVRARGHLPNEAAGPKRVYLAVMSLDPSGQGRRRMDHVLETSPERLRRTPVRRPQVAANNPSTPFVRLTDPPILRHHRM